jgi:hypothetical protein
MSKKYMSRVAELGCSLCQVIGYGPTPAEVHHLREGVGMAQRNSDFLTIPLCPEHHRGSSGVHGDRSALKNARQDEMSLLAWTIEALNG